MVAGRRGHLGRLTGLGCRWLRRDATLLSSSPLSRGNSRGGVASCTTGTLRGKDVLEGLHAKTFRPLAATPQARPPFLRPQVGLFRLIPRPCRAPQTQPARARGRWVRAVAAAPQHLGARRAAASIPGAWRRRAAPPPAPGRAALCCPWRPRAARAAERPGASGGPSSSSSSLPPPGPPPSPFQSAQCRNVPKMTSERSRIPCLSAAAAEGTGKKQQEGRAMATLDRKVPSPEAFLGKPWSSWIDAAKLHCSDSKNPTASSSFYYPVTFPFT